MTVVLILTLLAIVSALFHIRAEYLGPATHVYLFKPLTTILILLIAVLAQRPVSAGYKYLIVAGLLFSLAGDVFLMLPGDRFVAGLVSFLIAHLFYIAAFRAGASYGWSWGWIAPFALYGVVVFVLLLPHLGAMKLPVLVYVLVILVMAWQAWGRWRSTGDTAALLAFIGAALFVISDSVLAFNRFRGEFAAARALTLATYFSAQWLIAVSIRPAIG
ncbi:MAG: lysoplasmalogenase [Anaerolineae bacterium]